MKNVEELSKIFAPYEAEFTRLGGLFDNNDIDFAFFKKAGQKFGKQYLFEQKLLFRLERLVIKKERKEERKKFKLEQIAHKKECRAKKKAERKLLKLERKAIVKAQKEERKLKKKPKRKKLDNQTLKQ